MPITSLRTFSLALALAPHGPQAPQPDCSAPFAKSPQLPATIPIELHTNHVAFWVCRGATPMMYVLDTGAGQSFMDIGMVKQFGIPLTSSYRATGAGAGSTAAGAIRRDSVVIPGASVVVPIRAALDLASIGGPEGSKMQGILGADFIARYVVALDYRHKEMRLYDRATFTYSGPGTTVPISVQPNGFIRTKGVVGLADGSSVEGDMTIDVGASLSVSLPKPFVDSNHLRDRVGPTMHRPAGRGAGGVTMADVARVPSFKLGSVTIDKPIIYLYGDSAGVFSSGNLGSGNIGGDVLRRFTVYLDYRARRMILEPHDLTNEPFEADMSGLQLTVDRDSAGFRVDFVLDKSPAGELGMKKGDHIVAIDGKPASLPILEDLRTRFRREGEHISITVKRGMTPVVFELVTRRLV